jgi:signal transduction histidine kinase
VIVSARTEASEIVFEVRDSGPGIPADQIGHVFDRYWRGNGGASSGLGLYIAKAIVEGHGGRIWADSGNGRKGTTVGFALPVAAPSAGDRRDEPRSQIDLHPQLHDAIRRDPEVLRRRP